MLICGCSFIILLSLPSDPQGRSAGAESKDSSSGATKTERDEELYQKTRAIYECLDKLESGILVEQQNAFERLRSMGPMVLPFLSAHLKEKAVFLELTRQIIEDGFGKSHSRSLTGGLTTAPLSNIAALPLKDAFIEKYFYGRYLQALKLFDQENFQEAKELVRAILTIEKNLSFANQLQLLKIQCEQSIIQQGLIRATLCAKPREGLPAGLYENTDRIELKLKLENVSLEPLEMEFGKNSVIVLQIDFNLYDPFGNFNNKIREETIPLSISNLKLNPNEKREWDFLLDISRDNPNSPFYRTYLLSAEIRPIRIKSEVLKDKIGIETARKIVSTNVRLRVFPPEIEPTLKSPIEKLQLSLEGAIPLDVFLCSLLIPENQQAKAIELLITTLERPPIETLKNIGIQREIWESVIMNCLKHMTNLPFEVNKNTWIEWFKQKKK
ncbi:MAG: hypothetical protein QME16_01350 [Planctomycetota bacterium]|nr:hypothetical protein [Planctomycetota bacterium]